jgi:hypothetical protein
LATSVWVNCQHWKSQEELLQGNKTPDVLAIRQTVPQITGYHCQRLFGRQ